MVGKIASKSSKDTTTENSTAKRSKSGKRADSAPSPDAEKKEPKMKRKRNVEEEPEDDTVASSATTVATTESSVTAVTGHPPISNFRVSEEAKRSLEARGITQLFPIQEATFDLVYDKTDVIGRARTGTGKVGGNSGTCRHQQRQRRQQLRGYR
eukprot:GHVU01234902.1.p3 GENE.GHVU01234902.1~~GHVU01234902.1.p3  ORF type:complete len:154 (+),score=20.26 GHVU01234902.1:850-1311(+)